VGGGARLSLIIDIDKQKQLAWQQDLAIDPAQVRTFLLCVSLRSLIPAFFLSL
jgi:hypothetical protein